MIRNRKTRPVWHQFRIHFPHFITGHGKHGWWVQGLLQECGYQCQKGSFLSMSSFYSLFCFCTSKFLVGKLLNRYTPLVLGIWISFGPRGKSFWDALDLNQPHVWHINLGDQKWAGGQEHHELQWGAIGEAQSWWEVGPPHVHLPALQQPSWVWCLHCSHQWWLCWSSFKRLIFWLWSQISLSQISFWLVTLGFLFDLWLLGFFLTCDFGFLFGSGFCNQWGQYISGICSSVYRKVLVAEMARPRNTPRPWTHQPMPPPPKAPFVAWLWLEIIFCTWVLYWLCGYLWLLGTCGYLCLLVVTCGYLWLPAGCICHQRRPSSILPLLMYTYVVLLTKKKMMFWVTWFIDFWLTSAKASRCLTV